MGYERDDREAVAQRDHYGARDDGRRTYGRDEYGNARYGQREQQNAGRGFQNRPYGGDRDHNRGEGRQGQGYGRQPEGYDYDDRNFLARAGDEVRSWFGDDDAERRREADTRYDDRQYTASNYGRDDDYHQWRRGQIDALDRDYHEYRQEHRGRFENEFGSWRTERQTQRGSLSRVTEHMEVVGSDGAHIGTVDNVRGDRILLTKNDKDAGGRHHSIPSRWIEQVDDKVAVRKTAEEAKAHWRAEESNQAMFGSKDNDADRDGGGPHILNRSFSGTY